MMSQTRVTAVLLSVALSSCAARQAVPIAAGADLATTEIALQRGLVEVNPLMQNRGTRITLKLAATGLIVWLCEKLEEDGHDTAAKWLQWITVGAWGGAATLNTYTMSQQ
jgi:hypothetical protein